MTLARVAQHMTAMVQREFTPRVAIAKMIWHVVEVPLITPPTIPRVALIFLKAMTTFMPQRVAIFQPLEVTTHLQTSALETTARVELLEGVATMPLPMLVAILPRVAMAQWMSISPLEVVITHHLI